MSHDRESHNLLELIEVAYKEFCQAWLDGESPDREIYCQRFPSHRDEFIARIDKFIATYQCFVETSEGFESDPFSENVPIENVEGKTLGDFRLIREIGRGGMGVVYEAHQVSLDRTVALKVLPAHLTIRKDAVTRFQREASTASRLKHPGIVEIYSIGESEGNHFFAMELIEGSPLDQVINQLDNKGEFPLKGCHFREAVRQLTLTAKKHEVSFEPESESGALWERSYIEISCRIIAQVAEALEHAHEAGVIHRDIKPSNILIKPDGSAVLTDFGLARAEGLPNLSVTGELAGTPHYLAPEQATPKSKELDLRVDLYSLGVTLYELLTLIRPYEGKTFQEVLNKIVSKDPPLPRSKNNLIPKDLETICLMALEKNPDYRYQDASTFKEDLLNFLEFGPIKARPRGLVSRTYRVVRRYPAYSAMSAMVLLIIIVGPLVFGFQQKMANIRIRDALKKADAAMVRADEALVKAEKEEATAIRVSEYLARIFKESNPFISQGETVTAYDLLRRGSESIIEQLAGHTEVQVRLTSIIGSSYKSLGYYDEAEVILQKALDTCRSELTDTHELTISANYNLACLYLAKDQHTEAGSLLNKALHSIRTASNNQSKPAFHNLENKIRESMGLIYLKEENYEKAERIFKRLIAEVRVDSIDDTAKCRADYAKYNLAHIYMYRNMYTEAEILYQECLAQLEGQCNCVNCEYFKTMIQVSLGNISLARAEFRKAERFLLEAYNLNLRRLGESHLCTLHLAKNVANFYLTIGRLGESEDLYLKTLDGFSTIMGDDSRTVIQITSFLAAIYIQQNRLDEAEDLLIDSLVRNTLSVNDTHKTIHQSSNEINGLYGDLAEIHMAEELWMDTSACIGDIFDETIKLTSTLRHQLSSVYSLQGRAGDNLSLYYNAVEQDTLAYGDDHPSTLHSMFHLAMIYEEMGLIEEAQACYISCVEKSRLSLGEEHWDTIRLIITLGSFYSNHDQLKKAEPYLDEAFAYFRERGWIKHPRTLNYMITLAKSYRTAGRYKAAAKLTEVMLQNASPQDAEYVGLHIFRHSLQSIPDTDLLPIVNKSAPHNNWLNPLILASSNNSISVVTTIDHESAHEVLHECEDAHDQIRHTLNIEPTRQRYPITIYIASNLQEYNSIGLSFGNARSSNYAVFYTEEFGVTEPFSVTFLLGNEAAQKRFSLGLVKHAVVEQYLNIIDELNEIPAWFIKGQASKAERYYHPEYIKWSVRSVLRPLGGLIPLYQFLDTFDYIEHEIHMAGFLCAFLDSKDVNENVKTAFNHTLAAIRERKNITKAFQKLEKVLIDNEESVRAFWEKY